jgi:GH15 family glucan-1,4-alpha-glucosidase
MKLMKKSIKILKESQLENGGLLAAPRKSAYPYVYPRDAVIMTKALNRTGNAASSIKFYHFMSRFAKLRQYREIFHRYNMNGWPCVTRKDQNDNEGMVLHGIYDTYLYDKKEAFLEEMWPLVSGISNLLFEYSKTGLIKGLRSIHEHYDLEHGYDLWVNCADWRGLKDAAEIADILGRTKESKDWNKKAEQLLNNIKKKMFNKKQGVFMKNPRHPNVPDISQLAPFYFEMIEDKNLLRKTMEHVRTYLWNKEIGGFRRFRKFEVVDDWHWYTGGSGSWCVFAAWGARFHRKLRQKKAEKECIDWLHNVASRTKGLLPEHISTRVEYEEWKSHEIEFNQRLINGTKEAEKTATKFKKHDKNLIYWATPLGWSHAEYILMEKEK